ncbi:MAG: metallophosphoesterase family protein [Caldilineaceae bacterium]
MRILVFSDIHGNAVGLDSMLADVKGETFDQMVCLGDAIQGGPQPSEVVARLRDLNCPVVMGNADDWLLTGHASDAENIPVDRQRKMDAVRLWSLSQLSETDQAFIRTFQPTVEIPLANEQKLLCYHGSPKSFDDIIFPTTPEEEARRFLEPVESTIYTGGHTHIQFIRHFGRTFHFNPGSVGFAYRHDQERDTNFRADPWVEYAVLSSTGGRVSLEFRRVPYAAARIISVYHASGRPFVDEAIRQYRT